MCKTKFLCFIKQPSFVSSKRIDQLHNMFARLSSSLNLGSRYSLKLPKWMLYFLKTDLFCIFGKLFKQSLQILQQINVKNVHPEYFAGIWTHQPSIFEFPPITTRPGLPLKCMYLGTRCCHSRGLKFKKFIQKHTPTYFVRGSIYQCIVGHFD